MRSPQVSFYTALRNGPTFAVFLQKVRIKFLGPNIKFATQLIGFVRIPRLFVKFVYALSGAFLLFLIMMADSFVPVLLAKVVIAWTYWIKFRKFKEFNVVICFGFVAQKFGLRILDVRRRQSSFRSLETFGS